MKKSIIIFSIFFILTLITSCKTTLKGAASKENLTSKRWELSMMEGKSVVAAQYPNGLPDAVFSSDNRVSGHGGCNRYGGSFTLDAEGNLKLSQMISTKMFCEGVAENEFMKALAKVNKAKVEGENLVLYHENETMLVFMPKKLK
jgi:heat shock protein HslJ